MAKKKKKKNAPPEPKPINTGEVAQQGQQASQVNLDQLRSFYQQLAGDIGSDWTSQAAATETGRASQAVSDMYNQAGLVNQVGNTVGLLANQTRQSAGGAADMINLVGNELLRQSGQINTQETGLESELRRQAMSDLALGRSLSPEQQREAAQSARQAFAARGLGTGMGAAAAEILNRDRYATARQDARREFALGANENIEGTLGARRQLAGNMLGMTADAYRSSGDMRLAGDQAAGSMYGLQADAFRSAGDLMGNSGTLALNTAASYMNQNPFISALQGLGSGSSMIQTGSNLAGNTASFNTNMQASMYNSYLNNQASLQSARIGAGASQNAGMMGMIGGIGGGAAIGAGIAI